MPIYEFRCNNCNHEFDDLVKMGENGETVKCPNCKLVGATKLLSGSVALMGLPNTGSSQTGGVRQVKAHKDEVKANMESIAKRAKRPGRVIDLDK